MVLDEGNVKMKNKNCIKERASIGMGMHIVISTFDRPQGMRAEDLIEKFNQSALIYRDLEGLIRKHYLLGCEDDKAGGVYVFASRDDAEAWFTKDRIAWAEERFGKITFQRFDVPIEVTTSPPMITPHPIPSRESQ